MTGKIAATAVLSLIAVGALSDFVTVHHGRFDQFGFLFISVTILSSCAAVFSWRCWDGLREGYTYRQTPEKDGVELPRAAWSERLGIGALFNLRDRPDPPHSKG